MKDLDASMDEQERCQPIRIQEQPRYRNDSWVDTPSHISFNGLAVATHGSAPSSPLVEKVVVMERRQLCWQRENRISEPLLAPVTALVIRLEPGDN